MRIVPNWDSYLMGLAKAASLRSKDPITQVGSVIVNSNNQVLSVAYNGFEPGALETEELWQRPEKYKHVRHAEDNAIKFLTTSAENAIIYITMYPCETCSQLIVKAGIKKVIYLDPKYKNDISETIFKEAGIICEQLKE